MPDTKVSALTAKAAPVAADIVHILDSEASNADKRTTVGAVRGQVGTGSTANMLMKPDVNSIDSSTSCTISGGGATGTSLIDGTETERNVIGATGYIINYGGATIEDQASYVAGSADVSTIGGGYDNLNNQLAGTIAGGAHNALGYLGTHGTIGGGSNNCIVAATDYATIAGGTLHRIGTTAAADNATVGGGTTNRITQGTSTTIAGGGYNTISGTGTGATISGGTSNTISANNPGGVIAGGSSNTISGTPSYAAIVGGASNTVSGAYGVAGGQSNNVSNSHAAAFGQSNTVSGQHSFSVGSTNTVSANYSSVIGGISNTASGLYSVAMGNTCTAGHASSRASGSYASTPTEGAVVHATRRFGSVNGSAQMISFLLSNQTTDATPAWLYTSGSNYAVVPDNSAWVGTITLVGRTQGTQNTCSFIWKFALTKGTGNVTIEYEEARTALHDDIIIGAVPALNPTGTTVFRIQVTGVAATNIDWVARIDAVQTLQ